MTTACIVLTTTASDEEAERIARALLEEKLAACVQVQAVTSLYRWKGEIARDAERLLFIKTTADRWDAVRDRIVALHSYETPEILRVPVEASLDRYLAWLGYETRPDCGNRVPAVMPAIAGIHARTGNVDSG